ncbi:hypothetical protein MKZ21_23095 [Paenibacillus sp. FSL P2-0536]|uniref:hypothetical protein n=1 Tax=Paenibacillus sp. FSL P2-0536 TaxID=2921629 RepID=UPI0030F5EC36
MVGLIFIGDINFCPYLEKYTSVLQEKNIEYEVLFWNRENKNFDLPTNYIYFNKKSRYRKNPVFKILEFMQFSLWLQRIIIKKKYSKLIILSTLSGMFLANVLLKKYPGKYVFDIRDYSYEHIKFFSLLEEKLIKKSFFTCISSQGFKEFLPKNYPYVMAHNFNSKDLSISRKFEKKGLDRPLNLVWNGTVRYFEHQEKILSKLANDKRFNIIYHGMGSDYELYINFCEKMGFSNIKFTGNYNNLEKEKLLKDADILNNSYGTKKEMEVKYAMANRYYDGLIYKIPQLVEINTFKHKKVQEIEVGIGIDIASENLADLLYEYYCNINETQFNYNCNQEIGGILKEDNLYIDKIKEFFDS